MRVVLVQRLLAAGLPSRTAASLLPCVDSRTSTASTRVGTRGAAGSSLTGSGGRAVEVLGRVAAGQAGDVSVRLMRPADTPITTRLHRAALPDGFFVRLGPRFLADYHRSFVDSPHAVALVAVDDGAVVGFLVGAVLPKAHGSFVLRHCGRRLAVTGALAMSRRPGVLREFVRTRTVRYARGVLRRLRPVPEPPATPAGRPPAVLTHLAVDDEVRGRGSGTALVEEFHAHVERSGAPGVVLLTKTEGGATLFYTGLGYQDRGTVTASDGRTWRRLGRDHA